MRNAVLTTWLRRPPRHCVSATGTLLAAAIRGPDHARAAAEALRRLPVVLQRRRPLPAHVEEALAMLEGG
jgi:hypothetical protein